MSSSRASLPSAAWRLSLPTALAFATVSALALWAAYALIASSVRARSDRWLAGEAGTLAEVVTRSRLGPGNERALEEIAELARHELLASGNGEDERNTPTFFLLLSTDGDPAAWVGPEIRAAVIAAIQGTPDPGEAVFALAVEGEERSFRVASRRVATGEQLFLGLIDMQGEATLREIWLGFLVLWLVMLVIGLIIAWASARRILGRVDAVTATVAALGTSDLSRRVPEDGRHRDEISRLEATFNQMLARLESGVLSLRTLSEALTHDLKSPLTAIRGNLELALRSEPSDETRDAIGRTLDNVDRLLRNLEASLDVTEAEAGVLVVRREPVDLREFVEQLVDLYRPAAEERGLTIAVRAEGSPSQDLDPNLLGRALSNLLDNACAHLPAGCRLAIDLRTSSSGALIRYQDDGPGFPPGLRERAFERFAKGPGSQGHGLGLAVVHAAALAHGGSVRIGSDDGRGAVVEIELPRP